MKRTEYDYGWDYAEFLINEGIVDDADKPVTEPMDIPSDDYSTMVRDGIENPDARSYWKGYNDYLKA